MIKYRLRFKFQKETDPTIDRENNINSIISDIDSIVSDTPIRKPLDGEMILISGEEYKVVSTTIAFEKDGEDTFYDLVVLLKSNKPTPKTPPIRKEKDKAGYGITQEQIEQINKLYWNKGNKSKIYEEEEQKYDITKKNRKYSTDDDFFKDL